LAHDPTDTGASDTTPLFLIALALYRSVTQQADFLEEAAQKGLNWLFYQSPDDIVMVDQQPTSDWRDEQWVWGYGLYVNTLVYACCRLYGEGEKAQVLRSLMDRAGVREVHGEQHIHEGLSLVGKPYYALYVYKQYISERFDTLGNSLAIMFGLADQTRAKEIIAWVETACESQRQSGDLACDLPPCLIPFIQPEDEDWRPRYLLYNQPGEYHNGGIWPFISGFYVAALTAAGEHSLALKKFNALTELIKKSRRDGLAFGFNEWLSAQDCRPRGQDWQAWSAAMYLYAATCIERGAVPLFPGGFQ
jgi:hypothetical protein